MGPLRGDGNGKSRTTSITKVLRVEKMGPLRGDGNASQKFLYKIFM